MNVQISSRSLDCFFEETGSVSAESERERSIYSIRFSKELRKHSE